MGLVFVKGFVILSFVFMMIMNIVANTKPLYGNTTGEISDKYPTLFTPSGFTFSIWGIIYLLLVLFTSVYIIDSSQFSNPLLVGLIFGVSSLFNGLWLNFWHQDKQISASVIMIGILISLIYLYLLVEDSGLIISAPISVYIGWISVATIAQISIVLYPYRPKSYKTEVTIFFVVLVIGIVLAGAMTIIQDNWLFALVIIWGYWGIYHKHKELNHPFIERGILASISLIALLIVVSTIL